MQLISSVEDIHYFSKEDIVKIKSWMLNQKDFGLRGEQRKDFPKLDFKPRRPASDSARLQFYFNGILYTTSDIINGKKKTYNRIINMINKDNVIGEAGKIYLLSTIQLCDQVYTSKEAIQFYQAASGSNLRDICGCNDLFAIFQIYNNECQMNPYSGNPDCVAAIFYRDQYFSCLEKEPTCPYGFTFDGANCYSGIHFPAGYNGFVLGNGFYTQQNCSISTANDCCPPGFAFDGANCHYWELYFPSNYEAFILNNTFYVEPVCE